MKFERITTNPEQMGGEPCIRGMRMPVATLIRYIAEGWTVERIIEEWPDLERDDIREALLFASEATRIRYVPLSQ